MLCLIPDGNDAFVTGIVLYRNLASILPFQRYNHSISAALKYTLLSQDGATC